MESSLLIMVAYIAGIVTGFMLALVAARRATIKRFSKMTDELVKMKKEDTLQELTRLNEEMGLYEDKSSGN